MKKNTKGGRFERPKAKKKKKDPISGFTSLNQVTGVSKPRQHHSSIPVPEPATIAEPLPTCAFCGERIENIASSFMSPDGGYIHFDCVLDSITQAEHLAEGQKVSYLGSGNFGIVGKDEEGKLAIIKRIPFESADSSKAMKAYIEGLRH